MFNVHSLEKSLRMSGRRAGSLPPVKVLPNRRSTVTGTKFVENNSISNYQRMSEVLP